MIQMSNKKTDKAGYDEEYKNNYSNLIRATSPDEYMSDYENVCISPYCKGGNTKGYVRGEAIRRLLDTVKSQGGKNENITVLDAGFGQGELSVYLGCLGFNVIGIDISSEAKKCADQLAERVGVKEKCDFRAESLEDTSIDESSIDYIIGHASLHHFIKYDGVPGEFLRVLKTGGKGYFADSFGENKLYHIFHDKEKMERLGDVTLTKTLIESYFNDFDVRIIPTDWFVMLDKLYMRLLPGKFQPVVKHISLFHYWIDRKISATPRASLFLSGSVLTEISKI